MIYLRLKCRKTLRLKVLIHLRFLYSRVCLCIPCVQDQQLEPRVGNMTRER